MLRRRRLSVTRRQTAGWRASSGRAMKSRSDPWLHGAHTLVQIVGLFVAASCACGAENWPQFRGPNGDGMSDAKDLPVAFGESENLRWKAAIHGKAWSSPVVWGDQVWMTSAPEDGKATYAVCVDLNTGQIKRDIKLWDVPEPQYCIPKNSYASCTP